MKLNKNKRLCVISSLSLSLSRVASRKLQVARLKFISSKKLLAIFFLVTCYVSLATCSPALAKSKGQTVTARLVSLTENTLVYERKGVNQTIDISKAILYRSSGGRAQTTELKPGDTLKIKLKNNQAVKIIDKSIKRAKLTGFMEEVDDTNDTFLLQVKNKNYLVNIEEFTDMLYRQDTLQNGRTKTKCEGILNTNTKEMYKTEEIVMWSR